MANFVNRCIFNAASSGTVDFVYASIVTGFQSPTTANAVDGQVYSYSAQLPSLAQWEYGTGVYTASTQTVVRTTVLGNHFGTTAKVAFTTPPQVYLTPLAADLATAIIVSTTAPGNPQPGQVWFNPATQLESVAEYPSYAWSDNLSAGPVVVSGGGLIATRTDSSYPNIVAPGATAGSRSVSLLPSTQKYLFAITTSMDLSGTSGFGICDQTQTMGNGMFLGSPNPSHSIGYYVESLAFYYWVNNAGGFGGTSPIGNGKHYVAVDPVAKKVWVMPAGGTWNDAGAGAGDPALGTGGVPFTAIDVTNSRIVAQLAVNGDAATIDPTASGLGAVTGFTPLSQIVLWVPVTYSNPTAISAGWVNIKDFGAIGDGVAEDGPAFQAFTATYQGQNVILYLPPGIYRSGSNTLGLWTRIKRLTIIGYGATIDTMSSFGGTDDKYGLANSALVQNATIGDTQLTLVNSADASKFATDDWIMIGALCIQGDGIPPNPYFMEYVQVTSVSGGVVFLDNALFNGPYLSTYPYYSSNASGVNEGGPATIYNMTQMFPGRWDVDIFCFGVTFLNSAQMPGATRALTYRDCSWPGLQSSNFPNPIAHKDIIFDNCLIQGGGDIEIDKCMERMTFRNCQIGGYYNNLVFQSSSVQQLVIDGCKIYNLAGTPRCTYITDSWIVSLTPGPRSNGPIESLFIENSFVGSISFTGWGDSFFNASTITGFTFANGTFTRANTGSASCVTWAAPGVKCVFSGGGAFNRSPPYFTVLNVRGDPGAIGTGNVYIDTTLTSLPTWTQGTDPSSSFLPTIICCHPYPRVTIRNCRGDRNIMSWQNNANPYRYEGSGFQYQQILLTGNVLVTGVNTMKVEGYIQTINLNVLRAYTGANGSENMNMANFNTYPGGTFAGAASPTLVLNVKTAGLRTWTSGSWTGSVAGDTLPAITAGTWLYGLPEFYFDTSMAGDTLSQTPMVLVEVICDVGNIKYSWIEYGGSFIAS